MTTVEPGSYAMVQAAAAKARRGAVRFGDALHEEAARHGKQLDAQRLTDICRPEHFLARLGPVFERLERLDPDW